MTTAEEVANAIRQFNDSELKGRNIKVNEARPRESSFGGGGGGGGGNRDPAVARRAEQSLVSTIF